MWRIWLILDPRRSLIAILVFCFGMVMLNHFIQLSTPRYGSWLTQPRPAQGQRSAIEVPVLPSTVHIAQVG